jgi:hypothetical protein
VGYRAACGGLALLYVILALVVAFSMAPTYDEGAHLGYAAKILRRQPERIGPFSDIKMPVSVLNAPLYGLGKLLKGRGADPRLWRRLYDIRVARLSTIAAGLLLGLLLWKWAYELYGPAAALAVGVMYCFSPNLLAHSTLATTDLYAALAFVATACAHWKLAARPGRRTLLLASASLALSQITKFSALFLFVAMPLSLAPAIWMRAREGKPWLRPAVRYLILTTVLTIAVLNVAFVFHRPFTPLRSYRFESAFFQSAAAFPVLSSVPLPLPYAYLQGLDMLLAHEKTGETFGNLYLLGETRPASHPFRFYYLVAYVFKEPLALQVLLAAGLFCIIRRRTARSFLMHEWFLIAPIIVMLSALSLFDRSQIGIRHLLPALPFTLILAGSVFEHWPVLSPRKKICLALLTVWLVVSVMSYFPHLIPYMNELVPDRRYGWKILADSNLSWGQDDRLVSEFLSRNPDVKLNPESPCTGRILMDANLLVGVFEPGAAWLRDHYEPVGHVGYAHLLYVVPAKQPGR